jgi:hypothetical protein
MKFLNLDEAINLGGHKISLNDLYHLQAANQQLGQMICESFGAENLGGRIISGVVRTTTGSPTPTHFSYTGGWMVKGGKIYKVNPFPSTALGGGAIVWFEFKTINTYSPVMYQSGGSYQVHQEHQVDISYSVSPPAGTLNVDYTSPFVVYENRIEDIIADVAANKSAINDAWTLLDQSYVQTNLLHSGITSVASGTFIKYKKIGSSLFLNVNIVLSSPAPQNFSLKFPVALSPLIASNNPLIFATDTKAINEPAWVSFSKEVIIPSPVPALMVFLRNHADTTLHALSFSTVLELTL